MNYARQTKEWWKLLWDSKDQKQSVCVTEIMVSFSLQYAYANTNSGRVLMSIEWDAELSMRSQRQSTETGNGFIFHLFFLFVLTVESRVPQILWKCKRVSSLDTYSKKARFSQTYWLALIIKLHCCDFQYISTGSARIHPSYQFLTEFHWTEVWDAVKYQIRMR